MGFLRKIWSMIVRMVLSWILPIWILPSSNDSSISSTKNNISSYNKHFEAVAKCLTLSSPTTTIDKECILKQAERMIRGSLSDDNDNDNDNDNNKGEELPEGVQRELMPRHVAVILDGNRRWAKQKGHPIEEGYKAGLVALGEFLRLCGKWRIPVVSLFLFSSENWHRPKEEVDYLMQAFEETMKDEHDTFMRCGARVSVIGETSLFPDSLQEAIKQVEEETKNNTEFQVLLAMSYSGQNDITQACQSIATKVKDGILKPEDVTKSLVEQELQTKVTPMPCPDLLIRTSGELRISNYYLWQSAYTELYFADALWPDFEEVHFAEALRSYQQRGRRFGKK